MQVELKIEVYTDGSVKVKIKDDCEIEDVLYDLEEAIEKTLLLMKEEKDINIENERIRLIASLQERSSDEL